MVPMVSGAQPLISKVNATMDPIKDPEILAILSTANAQESLPANAHNLSSTNLAKASDTSFFENYVSPSKKIITFMKGKGYSNSQITDLLTKNGYGWDADTGATWKGTAPTTEELKIISQIRGPGYNPFATSSQNKEISPLAGSGRTGGAIQNVNDENSFFGINLYMSPGSMTVSSTGTFQHVVTTHVGKKTPSGQDDWTEAGVTNSMNDPYARYFTYDNDEGGWQFHGAAETGVFKNYMIYVSSTPDSSGYPYNTWINNNWVRSGHLKARQTGINNSNEIWTLGSNWFSHDSTNPTFQNEYLYKNSGLQQWGDYPNSATSWGTDPYGYALQTHYMNGGGWKFVSWNV